MTAYHSCPPHHNHAGRISNIPYHVHLCFNTCASYGCSREATPKLLLLAWMSRLLVVCARCIRQPAQGTLNAPCPHQQKLHLTTQDLHILRTCQCMRASARIAHLFVLLVVARSGGGQSGSCYTALPFDKTCIELYRNTYGPVGVGCSSIAACTV